MTRQEAYRQRTRLAPQLPKKYDDYAMSVDEIAEHFGVSHQRVSQLLARALFKVKKAGLLAEFVEV